MECENICNKPEDGFLVSGRDIQTNLPNAVATWHTHPNAGSNLSAYDYESFVNFPKLKHFIIGNDGVTEYAVVDGAVIVV